MLEGTIFDIKHFAVHDGPGIRQTVFFKGCPLRCWWCHNPESQSASVQKFTKITKLDGHEFLCSQEVGYRITSSDLLANILGDRVFFEESGGGVTFSGGEPCMQSNFLMEMLTLCRNAGIHTAVDTSGYVKKTEFQRIAEKTDLFLYDLKLIHEESHLTYTGVSPKQTIENLLWLDVAKIPYVIRIPVVQGITDTAENLSAILQILQKLNHCKRIELLPFHNISQHKYERFDVSNLLQQMPSMSVEQLQPVVEWFNKKGVDVFINA